MSYADTKKPCGCFTGSGGITRRKGKSRSRLARVGRAGKHERFFEAGHSDATTVGEVNAFRFVVQRYRWARPWPGASWDGVPLASGDRPVVPAGTGEALAGRAEVRRRAGRGGEP